MSADRSIVYATITILAVLATIIVGAVTLLTYLEEEPSKEIQTTVQTQSVPIVILARTTFNDNGNTYIIDFDGNVLKLNNSISIITVEV